MDNLIRIQGWLETIETQTVGAPQWLPEKQVFEYETVSVEVVAYLKAVRAVQSLKSIRLLFGNGLFIDFSTIIRCVLECTNEIYFLLENYPELSSHVKNFIQNFQEATIDELLSQKTNAVLSKKIRNASARVFEEGFLNFSQAQGALDRPYKILSGYVHAQYSHIMEIYGGAPGHQKFQVGGIANEQQKKIRSESIVELDRMTILALAFMAKKFNCNELLREISEYIPQSR